MIILVEGCYFRGLTLKLLCLEAEMLISLLEAVGNVEALGLEEVGLTVTYL
jgi:hypothetical protein